MNEKRLARLLLMTVVLLLAAYQRIYQLAVIPYGLIPDEVMRGYDAQSLWQTGADSFGQPWPLFLRGFDDYTPALYSYLSIPFTAIFGLGALGTRLASAIVGVVTVALAYPLIRHPFGEIAALTGAFLLAISPWHILASRTGTEWNLLAFGPVLVIVLAYRGLRYPSFFIAAGIAAGLALYGYAPIKAFLPLLIAGFVVLYWPKIYQLKKYALISLGLLILLAWPIFIFSFTPAGMQRFYEVYEGGQLRTWALLPQLLRNYISYFSPEFFILSQYEDESLPVYIAHLRRVDLLSWFELCLIIIGIISIFLLKARSAWFILFWLIVSPLGINLHSNSPWPTLWLTAIPVPHALAGAGIASLVLIAKAGFPKSQTGQLLNSMSRFVAIILLLGLGIGILRNFKATYDDLFYEYPIYGAKDGRAEPIQLMEALQHQYDLTIIPATSLATSIYLMYYTQYDPVQRHADLAEAPDQTWQIVGDYRLGRLEDHVYQPGCHLIFTTVAHSIMLRPQLPQLIPIREFYFPSGEPNAGLYALPSPAAEVVDSGIIFGSKIMLQGFITTSTADSLTDLRPGDNVCVVLQWQALHDIGPDYTVFVHLIEPDPVTSQPALWAQHDSPPLHGMKPTSTWQAGDIVQDIHRLTVPEDIGPGKYNINVGLYDASTGVRLLTNMMEDQLHLVVLEIKAK
jgi:4-amino-4-deoxy-L-arabinose transferase-like glycosyltransferase